MDIELDSSSRGFFLEEAHLFSDVSFLYQKKRRRQELKPYVEKALSSLYALAGASDEDHFIFTSSHTEAINHLLFSIYLDVSRKTGKNHFVTSVISEAPQIMGMSRLQEMGAQFDLASVNSQGKTTRALIEEAISPRTALVSLSLANGLTGVLQPLEDISALCKERGIYLHIDATHALGKTFFSFKEGLCDFLTFHGENMGAPAGTGALFMRQGLNLSPFIIGGNEQNGLRGGTYNYPLLFAWGKACEIAWRERDAFSMEGARLRAFFELEVMNRIPGAKILFRESVRVPHITAIQFPYVTGDALLYYLYRKKVFASQGGGNLQKIAHILKASGINTQSALTFSLSRTTTEDELLKAAHIIEEGVKFFRKTNEIGLYE